jgi:hypothetical protein
MKVEDSVAEVARTPGTDIGEMGIAANANEDAGASALASINAILLRVLPRGLRRPGPPL